MAERRSLIEGLKSTTVDPDVETAFVRGTAEGAKPKVRPAPEPTTAPAVPLAATPGPATRVTFSTRIRPDLNELVTRASLERKLKRVQPSSVADIVETALVAWLAGNGYPA
jgi:hypothetical protein